MAAQSDELAQLRAELAAARAADADLRAQLASRPASVAPRRGTPSSAFQSMDDGAASAPLSVTPATLIPRSTLGYSACTRRATHFRLGLRRSQPSPLRAATLPMLAHAM
jgi:hypothetical protein